MHQIPAVFGRIPIAKRAGPCLVFFGGAGEEKSMRTVTYGAACSLDGFIAGRDGAIDWLHFSRDVEEVMGEYWSTVDAVLMGRKTWEFAAAQGMDGQQGSAPDSGN